MQKSLGDCTELNASFDSCIFEQLLAHIRPKVAE